MVLDDYKRELKQLEQAFDDAQVKQAVLDKTANDAIRDMRQGLSWMNTVGGACQQLRAVIAKLSEEMPPFGGAQPQYPALTFENSQHKPEPMFSYSTLETPNKINKLLQKEQQNGRT